MKILHLTSDHKWTGPSEPMLNAALALRARGHRADVAFPPAAPGQTGQLDGHAAARGVEPVHRLERGQGYWPWRDRAEVRRLRALLVRERYDVVHAHHTRDHLMAAVAGRGLDTRLVVSWHHGEPIPGWPWSRLAYGPRLLSGLVVLSPRLAAAARERLGWPEERVAVVRGAVDSERFRPREPAEALRAELGLAAGERVVGLVARLQPQRRVDLLLDALARALPDAPGLRLVVVGRGSKAAQVLEEPVRALGLGAAVIRAGYRRDDYLDTLSLLDALVFLVPGSDGSCRAALEAMSMEIPVIASRRGVLAETVRDGETGRVIPERADALAEVLCELWRDPALWQARGKAARRAVLEAHTLDAQAAALEGFYERL